MSAIEHVRLADELVDPARITELLALVLDLRPPPRDHTWSRATP
jgi:hypothetical protein